MCTALLLWYNITMDRRTLPTSILIGDKECPINTDYRDILDIFTIFNDPDLLDGEKIACALDYFYQTDDYKADIDTAVKEMMYFLQMGDEDLDTSHETSKPLYDWDQDFNIIVAPINKNMGTDIRNMEHLHWWTFFSAFMEIGESTFSTFVSIRDKLNKGKRLDKTEEKIYKENKDKIVLKKKYDSGTQELIDEIMGRS